MSFVKYCF